MSTTWHRMHLACGTPYQRSFTCRLDRSLSGFVSALDGQSLGGTARYRPYASSSAAVPTGRDSHHATRIAAPMPDARDVPVGEIVKALDEYGIDSSWVVSATLRLLPPESRGFEDLPRLKKPSDAFRNLIVGTVAEGVFEANHLVPLKSHGFDIVDFHEAGENRDFGVRKDGLELPINVKTASTIFRNAKQTVGLEPEDCIPISVYKALGASERVPDLVYVDLVDFKLRDGVDAAVAQLEGPAAILWDLLSWYAGSGAKRAQDRYIKVLFETQRPALEALVADSTKFRVISAKKVIALMHEKPRRVPGLGIKAAGTGSFVAEVNMHVSVKNETKPWAEVDALIREGGIQPVLDLIRLTSAKTLPSPEL
jgi:hypothetical protein